MAKLTEKQVYNLALQASRDIAPQYGADPVALARALTALAYVESSYNPDAQNKKSSARGLMQMLKGTQQNVEVKFMGVPPAPQKIFDPEYALQLAGHYLGYQYKRYNKDWTKAAHAYNQGSFPGTRKKDGENYARKFAVAVNSQTDAKNLASAGTKSFSLEFL